MGTVPGPQCGATVLFTTLAKICVCSYSTAGKDVIASSGYIPSDKVRPRKCHKRPLPQMHVNTTVIDVASFMLTGILCVELDQFIC